MARRIILFLILSVATVSFVYGQKNTRNYIIYPDICLENWKAAYGLTFMTTPSSVTEEFHRRIPAGEFCAVKQLSGNFYLNPKLRFQFLQNELILNVGYLLSNNNSWAVATEIGSSVWAGILKTEAYDRKGYGFMCYPAIKAGYKLKQDLLLTLKVEAIFNLKRYDIAGKISRSLHAPFYSGQAVSFFIEQPFFKSTNVILGFRAMYCDFYWQTWTLNESFEDHIFYPEILIELIL